MAAATGLSQTAVVRIWKAFGLQPHRTGTFKQSADPQFIDKVRDIVGLYLDPPDRAIVLCIDEKTQVQALDRTQPLLPLAAVSWASCVLSQKQLLTICAAPSLMLVLYSTGVALMLPLSTLTQIRALSGEQ